MNDLISRQAAIDALGDVHPLDYNAIAVRNRIKALPSAEPEIVLCKDCMFFSKAKAPKAISGKCDLHGGFILQNDFCSYATKKEIK